jgi:hypothetical protein
LTQTQFGTEKIPDKQTLITSLTDRDAQLYVVLLSEGSEVQILLETLEKSGNAVI